MSSLLSLLWWFLCEITNIRSLSPSSSPKLAASVEQSPTIGNLSWWITLTLWWKLMCEDLVSVMLINHRPKSSQSNIQPYPEHLIMVTTLTNLSSLGDLPCLMSTGEESSSRRRAAVSSCCYSLTKKTISPRKRSRTSRVQHIQRPCLDFEKMQQVWF